MSVCILLLPINQLQDNTVIKVKFLGIALVQLVILFTVCWFGEAIGEKVKIESTIISIKYIFSIKF